MPISIKYRPLKARMVMHGITQGDIARHLGRSDGYMTQRMGAHAPFDAKDMVTIKAMLQIRDRTEFLNFFFPDEKWDD